MAIELLEPVALGVFALYLSVVGAWDIRTRRIPNALVLPAIGLVLLWRALRIGLKIAEVIYVGSLPILTELLTELNFLLYWVGIFMLWQAGIMGGGDAKLLMVLFGVFPAIEFLGLLLAVTGLAMAAVLSWRYGRQRKLGLLISGFWSRLRQGQFFPTEAELTAEGEPTAFLFAVAGMVMIIWVSIS